MYFPNGSFSFKNPDLSTSACQKLAKKKEKKRKGEASLDVGRSFVKDVTESNIWDFTPRCRLTQPCQQVLHMNKGTDVTVRRISKENHNFLRNFFPGK